jgi:TRAP-type C4-dicarboxylate transport system substrate-binding protein
MRFVNVCCLILTATLLPGHGAAFAQELKISHQWAEADGRDRAIRVFVQEAESRAKGLKFRIYPNSSLNIEPERLLEALQNNSLELAVFPLSYAVAKVPEFSLARLPGLVPNLEAAHALKGTEMHATLQSIAEANGVRIITWWWAPGGFFSKSREISNPKSVQGLKMRGAEPLFELMLKEAGASIASMPSTKLSAAMQSGALDAIGTTYEAFLSFRLYEQVKFATVGGPTLFMGFTPMVMSLTAWNGLTPEQKAALEEAAEISDAYFEAAQRSVERQLVATLRKAGVAYRQMTKENYMAWLQLAQQTAWLEYTKINPRARELLVETVRTFLEKLGPKDEPDDGAYREEPR